MPGDAASVLIAVRGETKRRCFWYGDCPGERWAAMVSRLERARGNCAEGLPNGSMADSVFQWNTLKGCCVPERGLHSKDFTGAYLMLCLPCLLEPSLMASHMMQDEFCQP